MPKYKIRSKNDVQYVEITITDETVIVEAGLMHYYLGNITMENPMPGAGKIFKAKLSGEKAFRPRYHGTGKLVLTPSFEDYFAISLNDEAYIIDKGAFCASDENIMIDISVNKALTGMLSGEGMVQTLIKGTGTVIIAVPGPVEKIQLENETLVVDGDFTVARSQSLNFQTQKVDPSIIKSITSGEGWVNVIQGTGTVFISPVPNKNILFQEHIDKALSQSSRTPVKEKAKFQLPGCLVNLLTIGAISFFVYFLFIYYFSQLYQ
ncbi:MAG: AIM24 family protein [Candidatus Magnetomorum sp.]|nr:AIM24 family protein [Candidatus Magnetomorum sp.]